MRKAVDHRLPFPNRSPTRYSMSATRFGSSAGSTGPILLLAAFLLPACSSHRAQFKSPEGHLYVEKTTSFFGLLSTTNVLRCVESSGSRTDCAVLEFDAKVLRSDTECRSEAACSREGRCTASGRGCVASVDNDCRGSNACKTLGACGVVGTSCAATSDTDCQAATACAQAGACHLGPSGQCVATSADDCKASTGCLTAKRCNLSNGRCVGNR